MSERNRERDRAIAALHLWGSVRAMLFGTETQGDARKSRIEAQLKAMGLSPVYPRRKHAKPINHREIERARKQIALGMKCGFSAPVLDSAGFHGTPMELRQAYRLPDDPEDAVWIYLMIELLLARMDDKYRVLAVHRYESSRKIQTVPGTETQEAKWLRHKRLIERVEDELEYFIDQSREVSAIRKVS